MQKIFAVCQASNLGNPYICEQRFSTGRVTMESQMFRFEASEGQRGEMCAGS